MVEHANCLSNIKRSVLKTHKLSRLHLCIKNTYAHAYKHTHTHILTPLTTTNNNKDKVHKFEREQEYEDLEEQKEDEM